MRPEIHFQVTQSPPGHTEQVRMLASICRGNQYKYAQHKYIYVCICICLRICMFDCVQIKYKHSREFISYVDSIY